MLKNIKLILEYDGTNFAGWEIQPQKRTVRGEIVKALQLILQEKIKLTCASRTDAGVHAIAQVANFKTHSNISASQLRTALLGNLPRDIIVKSADQVSLKFDSRRDAVSKVYLYRLLPGRSALNRMQCWEYNRPLDIEKMKKAIFLFVGQYSFDLLSYRDSGECELKRLELTCKGKEIHFEIEADRFLHRMIRMIIGTLTELGRGKITKEDIQASLELQGKKHLCAPPQGLYLKEVKYS